MKYTTEVLVQDVSVSMVTYVMEVAREDPEL